MKPTVGEQLRSARESKGLTIEDAVKATNIRSTYLQELENDHPELLNSSAQAHGFLRLYASYLGIPAAPLIAQWETPADVPEIVEDEKVIEFAQTLAEKAEDTLPIEHFDNDEVTADEPAIAKNDLGATLQEALKRIPKLSQFLPGKKSEKAEADDKKEEIEPVREPEPEREIDESAQVDDDTVKITRKSGEILEDIGSTLRERREALELTLTDIETFTNVKRMYLEAMEAGRFDELPSTVQGRGMLNNYSKFLALDETWIMDAYAKALLAIRKENEPAAKKKIQPPLTVRLNIPPKIRSLLNPDLIIGGVFIIAIFVFIIWGGAQVFTASRPTATSAPSISEMLQQTPTATQVAASVEEASETETEETPIPGVTLIEPTPTVLETVNSAPLQLYIISKDRAYLRVISDQNEEFNGRVASGDVFTFYGEETISLLTGNGAALEVYFNQEYLGNLGNVGEVVDIAFSLEGLSTATPSPTNTPTLDTRDAEGDAMEAMEDN